MTHQDFDDADLIRTCTRKKGYPTEESARHSAGSIRKAHPTAEVRVYSCRRCGQWHVGGVPYTERRYDLQDPVERDEWEQEIARQRSRGRRMTRKRRGEPNIHRLSRRPKRERGDREERYR